MKNDSPNSGLSLSEKIARANARYEADEDIPLEDCEALVQKFCVFMAQWPQKEHPLQIQMITQLEGPEAPEIYSALAKSQSRSPEEQIKLLKMHEALKVLEKQAALPVSFDKLRISLHKLRDQARQKEDLAKLTFCDAGFIYLADFADDSPLPGNEAANAKASSPSRLPLLVSVIVALVIGGLVVSALSHP